MYVIHKANFIIMSQAICKKVHYTDQSDLLAFNTLFSVKNLIPGGKLVLKLKKKKIYIYIYIFKLS